MKQTAVDWLVDQVENFNCMKLGLIPSNIIEEAKKREESNLLRYGFKCFWLGVLASIIGTLLAKFI
jgi:uncharacterized membrane protein